VTPLQYEEVDGTIFVGSARGTHADWFSNLRADPNVEVQIGAHRFKGVAQAITDPIKIADFLELRLKRHPKIVGTILRSEGLSPAAARQELERYAGMRALVAINPIEGDSDAIYSSGGSD
jgi:hypothetical protein